jgi:hypothetical protein
MSAAAGGTVALHGALAAVGGTIADALVPRDEIAPDGSGPAQLAAAGPRTADRAGEYELLVEMIDEGARLHYGTPRVVALADPDLALLLGDQLYALGLRRLAELGDVAATAELADLISLVAEAGSRGDDELLAAIWEAGAVAIGWGTSDELEAAKALARIADPSAAMALRSAARQRRGS